MALIAGLGLACGPFFARQSRSVEAASAPFEVYGKALKELGLAETRLGKAWFEARKLAVASPEEIELPLIEFVYFDATKPNARAFTMQLKRGQRLTVTAPPPRGGRLFFELLRASEAEAGAKFHRVAASELAFELEIRTGGNYMLVVQPELLTEGRFELMIQAPGTLQFPVEGRTASAIKSFWGASRDGGRRKHEGVDIFAPRGTPVVAAAAGRVTHVHLGHLGGKVVWMKRAPRGPYLYYAHLDEQLVVPGMKVAAGDVLGTVGNTGNARTTPPHLHFGIYRKRAMDPFPWIDTVDQSAEPPGMTKREVGTWMRVKVAQANLRGGPDTKHDVLGRVPRHFAFRSQRARRGWVELPDGAWIHGRLLESTDKALGHIDLNGPVGLQRTAHPDSAFFAQVDAGLEVIGKGPLAQLVRDTNKTVGWISTLGQTL